MSNSKEPINHKNSMDYDSEEDFSENSERKQEEESFNAQKNHVANHIDGDVEILRNQRVNSTEELGGIELDLDEILAKLK